MSVLLCFDRFSCVRTLDYEGSIRAIGVGGDDLEDFNGLNKDYESHVKLRSLIILKSY